MTIYDFFTKCVIGISFIYYCTSSERTQNYLPAPRSRYKKSLFKAIFERPS